MTENDSNMIDLVLTLPNQPPWTLATLGDHWRHGNFGHFQACRQWENALKAEVNIWDGNEILHWHALSHVLVVFPFKVHIATIINVVLECFLLPCLLLHLREPRQQIFFSDTSLGLKFCENKQDSFLSKVTNQTKMECMLYKRGRQYICTEI